MAPRGQALPQAATESAREARKSFFCELCQKGYARSNDFEAHENSYDHQHRKRLKEMRHLTRDPNAAAKARAAEREEADLKAVNLSTLPPSAATSASGKKRPVFKSTLQPKDAAALGHSTKSSSEAEVTLGLDALNDASGATRNGWFNERYQPRFVTGCDDEACGVCVGGRIDLGAQERELGISGA